MGLKTFEERLESKYIRHLRKEIIKLKRENRQLRKKVRQQEYEAIPIDPEPEPALIELQIMNNKEKVECPKCGSYDVDKFRSGVFDFYRCSCGSKGRLEKAS